MKAQQPIPAETREAASKTLTDLANTMMRSAQGLFRNSAYLLNADVEVHGRVVSDLRRYYTRRQPCSDDVLCIEALLSGMPAEQCITGAEKRRQARQEEKCRWEEDCKKFERQRAEERELKREARVVLATAILSGTTRETEAEERRVDGNVINGPWGEAS